jgi:hypothetical protein
MTAAPSTDTATSPPYRGEVAFLYAFDIAYDLKSEPASLLGQPMRRFAADTGDRGPRQGFFFRPMMVTLPDIELPGSAGAITFSRNVKLFPIGAVSVALRARFEAATAQDLVEFHALDYVNAAVHQEAHRLAEEVRREIQAYAVRAASEIRAEEAYIVFCFDPRSVEAHGHGSTEAWLDINRRRVAALLTQERSTESLSDQEVQDTTSRYLSYHRDDLVIADWDAALVIEDPRHFDELLHIMELANVQLAELEAYDRLLDEEIGRSYADLQRPGLRKRDRVRRKLREIRVDLARFSDELQNITKFFGDWHTARVYQSVAERFHLPDWHAMIDSKLKTLDELYEMLKQEQNNRWMLVLEATIVLLFILDLVILFGQGK